MKNNKGVALVEVLIGSAIISVGILASLTTFNTYLTYALANQSNVQASYLLEEGMEVMASLRDKSWGANISGLGTTTPYYIVFNGSTWTTTTVEQYVDGVFLRSINISDVNRDGNDNISTTAGTYDPNTKQITLTVSYFQGHATTTKSISSYITNLYAN